MKRLKISNFFFSSRIFFKSRIVSANNGTIVNLFAVHGDPLESQSRAIEPYLDQQSKISNDPIKQPVGMSRYPKRLGMSMMQNLILREEEQCCSRSGCRS